MGIRTNVILAILSIVVVFGVWFKIYLMSSQIKDLEAKLQKQKARTLMCENLIQTQNAKIKEIELTKAKFNEPKVITKIKYLTPKDDSCEAKLSAYEKLFEFGANK